MIRMFLSFLFLITVFIKTVSAGPVLLFDQGHGQAFTIEKKGALQLNHLAELFRDDGWQVRSSSGEISAKNLLGIDALVISGAFRPFSRNEIEAIVAFLEGGGRVAIMLHVASPVAPLLYRLDVVTANGVVREGKRELVLADEPLNFKVVDLPPHEINGDLVSFSLYGGWPLLPQGKHTFSIANTSPVAWVDLDKDKVLSLNDAQQKLSVVVVGTIGKGSFVVFADDAIFQNRFLKGENLKLASNFSRWLMQGVGQTGTEI